MSDLTPQPPVLDPNVEQVRAAAVDAAMAVFDRDLKLMAPHRYLVVEALDAAADVFDRFETEQVDRLVQQTGFAGMDVLGPDVAFRIKHAHDYARAVVANFDELVRQHGCENYLEQEITVTDPAAEQAADAGLPVEQWPPHRRYTFIIVRPGGKTPHQLRQEADRRAADLAAENERLTAALQAAEHDIRRRLCEEICELAGNMTALKMLIEGAGGDDGPVSLSRARSLLRELASLGGPLDHPDLQALMNAPIRIWFCPDRAGHTYPGHGTVDWRDGVAHCLGDGCIRTSADKALATRYWAEHQVQGLVDTGVPVAAIAQLRDKYVADVCGDPVALRQLQQTYSLTDGSV